MFLDKYNQFFRTIAFRLTLWYAGIFIVSTTLTLLLIYFLTTSLIRNNIDNELLKTKENFLSLRYEEGMEAVIQSAIQETRAAGEKKIFFRIIKAGGGMFYSSSMDYWKDIEINNAVLKLILESGNNDIFETVRVTKRKHEVRILYVLLDQSNLMQIGYSLESYMRIIEVLRNIVLTMLIPIFSLSVLGGWFMAKRALTGVDEVTKIAREITGGALEKRVPLRKTGDEIDRLAITMNQMLDRIQRLITNIKEMNDNIAHDLRSPITRIRGAAEITLTTDSPLEEYRHLAASTIEECDGLLSMINTMLIISKTEAGVREEDFLTVDLSHIAEKAMELFQASAQDKNIRLISSIGPEVNIRGEAKMLQRVLANLLDNAIKYSLPGGNVEILLNKELSREVILTIKDTGIGIAPADLARVFERFFRCDPSRAQAGSGLGLSLVKAIVNSHGGTISVESTLNQGSTFTVRLPAI